MAPGERVAAAEALGVTVAGSTVPDCEALACGEVVAVPQPVKLTEALPVTLGGGLPVPLTDCEPVSVGGGALDMVTDTVTLTVRTAETLREAVTVPLREATLAVWEEEKRLEGEGSVVVLAEGVSAVLGVGRALREPRPPEGVGEVERVKEGLGEGVAAALALALREGLRVVDGEVV